MGFYDDRAKVVAAVTILRSSTPCEACGRVGKIEWHSTDHEIDPKHRISTMVWGGANISEVMAEIPLCTALCRGCHIHVHGQIKNPHWPACGHPKEGNRDRYPVCPICRKRRNREYMRRRYQERKSRGAA